MRNSINPPGQRGRDRAGEVYPDQSQINSYYLERIGQLGLSEAEAQRRYHLYPDQYGNILQYVRQFDGSHHNYYQKGSPGKSYAIKRMHPDALKRSPDLPKYLAPKKEDAGPLRPMPMPLAIERYQRKETGGHIAFVEGYFKAVAQDRAGLESVAFSGNQYKMCDALADYLTTARPDTVSVIFDGDARDLSKPREGEPYSDARPFSFYNSALKFCRELFRLFDSIDHRCDVRFVVLNPDQPKGTDDLLEIADAADVMRDLETGAGRYFTVIPVHKSTVKRKLSEFFGFTGYAGFYAKHSAEIGGRPFRYRGAVYDLTPGLDLMDNRPGFRMLTDPLAVDVETIGEHTVKKYLAEKDKALKAAIEANDRLAIEAPTGSGKTTWINDYLKRTGTPAVFVFPTVLQAKQQGKKEGRKRGASVYTLTGGYKPNKANKAQAAQIVFCTYDTLHHLEDLHRRWLIIDEAHNLINQYGVKKEFRAKVLRRVMSLHTTAKKAIFLSGTMPKILCNAFSLPLLRFYRTDSPTVRIFKKEATSAGKTKLRAALIEEIVSWSRNNPTAKAFVFWNNKEELAAVAEYLIIERIYQPDKITIVTADTRDDSETYEGIAHRERVPTGVRLVLCTSLLAEGINVNNPDFGRAFVVGLRCPDTFRQFVARVRRVQRLEVVSILPPETDVAKGFAINGETRLKIELADAAANVAKLEAYREAHRAEYSADELQYLGRIEDDQRHGYKPELYRYVSVTSDGFEVDPLAVLATIREDVLTGANNCYLYSRLASYPGIEVYDAGEAVADEETADKLAEDDKARKESDKAFRAVLSDELAERGGIVVKALHKHYKGRQSRRQRAWLERLAPDLLETADETAAAVYLEANRDRLDKDARSLIRRFVLLRFAGVPADQIPGLLEMKDGDFWREWSRLKIFFGGVLLQSQYGRKQMTTAHRAEVRDYLAAAEALAALRSKQRGTVSKDQVTEAVARSIGAKISSRKALEVARIVCDVRSVRHDPERLVLVHFDDSQNVPKFAQIAENIKRKPLILLDLWGSS